MLIDSFTQNNQVYYLIKLIQGITGFRFVLLLKVYFKIAHLWRIYSRVNIEMYPKKVSTVLKRCTLLFW